MMLMPPSSVTSLRASLRNQPPWALITVSPAQPGQGFFGEGGV